MVLTRSVLAALLLVSASAHATNAISVNKRAFGQGKYGLELDGCRAGKQLGGRSIDGNVQFRDGLRIGQKLDANGEPVPALARMDPVQLWYFGDAQIDAALGDWFRSAWNSKGSIGNPDFDLCTVTLTAYDDQNRPLRRIHLFEAWPNAYDPAEYDAEGVRWQVLSIVPNGFEMEAVGVAAAGAIPVGKSVEQASTFAVAGTSDNFAQVRGFKVDITQATGKEVDTAWESVAGGELTIETTETMGSDKFQTNSPGHKTVGEITLRGAMTDGRKAMCDWITDTVNGKPWKRDLTITELLSVDGGVKDGKQYRCEGFPVGYKPGRAVTGNVQEEIGIRPIRCETK